MNTDEQRRLHLDLRRRQGQLEAIAKGNRKTYSLGKGVGLMGGIGAAWLLCIANPAVGAVVGAIALVNYAAAAMQETEKTGEYRPLLGRKSLANLAMGLDRQGAGAPPSVTNQKLRCKQTEYETAFFYQILTPQGAGNLPLKRLKMMPCI